MGACMCLASFSDPVFEKRKDQDECLVRVLETAKRRIQALTDGELAAFEEECGTGSGPGATLKRLLVALQDLEDALLSDHREAGFLPAGGLELLVSGGPSYGDGPTLLYNSINCLRCVDALCGCRAPWDDARDSLLPVLREDLDG